MSSLNLNAKLLLEVRWSRGSCGQAGCTDPECVCGLCAQAIGLPEDDPRRDNHDEDCAGCPVCEDDVPVMLFKPVQGEMRQAAFHTRCFRRLTTEQ